MSLASRAYPADRVEPGAQRQPVDGRSRAGWIALAILVAALAPAPGRDLGRPMVRHPGRARARLQRRDPGVVVRSLAIRRSPFRDVYTVRWQPIPNWAGPLSLAGLVAILPAWVADRIMTSLTLAGFAAAILWLRWRVAGRRGLASPALCWPRFSP